ncbi:hypothetical protein GCM10010293_11360 [Streptomyces griseoflavus]|nr:hypothetical protein GCM10010293_11360 [Streptomyces griseoflavus]
MPGSPEMPDRGSGEPRAKGAGLGRGRGRRTLPRHDPGALVTRDGGTLRTARAEGLPAHAPGMPDRTGA